MWHKESALGMLCFTSQRNLNSEERKNPVIKRVFAPLWFVEPRLCMSLFPVGFATAFVKISMQLRTRWNQKMGTTIHLQGQPASDSAEGGDVWNQQNLFLFWTSGSFPLLHPTAHLCWNFTNDCFSFSEISKGLNYRWFKALRGIRISRS